MSTEQEKKAATEAKAKEAAEKAAAEAKAKEEKAAAEAKAKEEAEAAEKAAAKPKKLKVVITSPVAGKYNMPYNVGQTVMLDEKQALELIEEKAAKKA